MNLFPQTLYQLLMIDVISSYPFGLLLIKLQVLDEGLLLLD